MSKKPALKLKLVSIAKNTSAIRIFSMKDSKYLSSMALSPASRTNKTGWVKLHFKWIVWWLFWTALMLLGLVLSQWQWARAAEKTQIEQAWLSAPVIVQPQFEPLPWSNLSLTGEFLTSETLWLDNRIYQGQLGVAVLTPLMTDQNQWWLIQRGFIPTSVDRRIDPVVETPSGQVTLTGRWQTELGRQLVLGTNREGMRLQSIDLSAWQHLGDRVFEGVVHQTDGDGLLQPWWTPNQMPPERHQAYAVQWLMLSGLCIVVAVLGFRVMTKEARRES
ncbi:SURF1 family protein [Limnospira platensis]|uniref:SURF1 family protein n=1 Tax=Limnospira platensis TaxID=118562 RepID=UPI003D6E24E0